ncbi:nickel-dependent lactate racemase [Paenibacillus cremeus]|uniref:nickel-dependent lactate racemase n=1 Tax=Paenibacillus cremeus TaxID=2163881 RepID=UPI0021BD1559|nr:nickel-dependent lactate racemase [Paenibacillus cremeus]
MRYGKTTVSFDVPESHSYDLITYKQPLGEPPDDAYSLSLIRQALAAPIGTPSLRELATDKTQAVILISDGTRLCPSWLLLPPLLEELNAAGIPDHAIDIVIALGLHRKHTAAELEQLVGTAIYQRIRVSNHSSCSEDCTYAGTTSRGTPIEINHLVAQAPLRIVTGNIEPHALVGISGGIKALVPGVASQRCIEHNHGLSLEYKAIPGHPNNPLHQDLEEAQQFAPIDFMLNVVVNHDRQVLHAAAGHIIEAHRQGTVFAAKLFLVPVQKQYDIVVVSPGGFPKDLQFYQALKALRNAAAITKPHGTIIMAAECSEQFGNGIFQYWVETIPERERAVAMLKQTFVAGAHKLLHLDEVLQNHPVYLHTSLPNALIDLLGCTPAPDLSSTLKSILLHPSQSLAIMPFGALTFPVH